jgi:hypothetical protein
MGCTGLNALPVKQVENADGVLEDVTVTYQYDANGDGTETDFTVDLYNTAGCTQYSMPEDTESASALAGYIVWTDIPDAPYLCRPNMRPAREFFRVTITREINPDNCKKYADGDESTFSPWAALASLFVWLCVFFAIFNGVNSTSYVIWFTVPVPIVFILVMLFHGLSLDGSKDGIK